MHSRQTAMVVLSFLWTGWLSAQTSQDSTRRTGWEVGVDLLWLIEKNNIPEKSVFIRKNYNFQINRSKGLRFRIGIDGLSDKGISGTTNKIPNGSRKYIAPYLSLGHEWKNWQKKSCWFFGFDLFGEGYFSNETLLVTNGNGNTYHDINIENYSAGISLLTGYQIELYKGFSLSIESSLFGAFSKETLHSKTYFRDNMMVLSRGQEEVELFLYNLRPLSVIHLLYSISKNKKL